MSHAAYTANFSSITRQTRPEDIANSLTHGLGLLLAIGGTSVLVVFASIYGSVWHVVSFSIYGATLMLLFAVSTVYHATRHLGRKKTLQIVDHASIFLLIAGTYTPFTFVPLNGGWGWSLFGVVWGLSAVGICAKIFLADRFDLLSTLFYSALSSMGVIAIVPLAENLSVGGLVWLISGGVVYGFGAIFYLWEKLSFNHVIWHLFVLAGATCQFFAILFHVLQFD